MDLFSKKTAFTRNGKSLTFPKIEVNYKHTWNAVLLLWLAFSSILWNGSDVRGPFLLC